MQPIHIIEKNIDKTELAPKSKLTPQVLTDHTSYLYGITLDDMRVLMSLKRRSRLKKKKDFNCFVMGHLGLTGLIATLRQNITQLPDGTRFQVAICSEKDTMYHNNAVNISVEHWIAIDFFVKANTLHTLTIDAVNLNGKLNPILKLLTSQFPTGKHYFFNNFHGAIQYSSKDCQTFTREHIGMLSDLDSNKLYQELEINITKQRSGGKYFTLDDIGKGRLPSLVPLVRSMQSVKNFNCLSEDVKHQQISRKGYTLNEWISMKTQRANKNGNPQDRNISILSKDHAYRDDLVNFTKCANEETKVSCYRSGLGYITIIAKITPYLQNLDKQQMKILISDFISCLEKTPKYRDNFLFGNFFQLKAAHFDRINRTKSLYETLFALCNQTGSDLKTIKEKFKDITENYADYLIHCDSVRNMQSLMGFFNDFIAEKPLNNEDLKLSASKVA